MSPTLSPPSPASLQRFATPPRAATPGIGWRVAVLSAAGAITSFHVSFLFSHLSGLMVLFVFGLTQLSGLRTARQAFSAGMGVGYAVHQDTQALVVPTMDVADWGAAQHRLHARIAPVRAAEYGLPVFRVCSSGISQVVDARGCVRAYAPCPGQGAILAGVLDLGTPGQLPADRYLGPATSGLSAAVWAALLWVNLNQKARALFGQRAREEAR